MSDDSVGSNEERLAELRGAAEVIAKLAEDEEAFAATVEAFRAQDAARFQEALSKVGLAPDCHRVCWWLCQKHCIAICIKLAGPPDPNAADLPIEEIRAFAQAVGRIAADEALLGRLVAAVDAQDAAAFDALVSEQGLKQFAHQLCHWLCHVRCKLICRLLCPRPLITHVGNIRVQQISFLGYGAGPSNPAGYTQNDDKPNGIGDHPFGARIDIRGVFNVANPLRYKVEFTPDPLNVPWQPIKTDLDDECFTGVFETYQRGPDGGGWYLVGPPPPPCPPLGPLPENNGMGIDSMGHTFLTQWVTPPPAGPSDIYHLRLTVENPSGSFVSPIVRARTDNVIPTKPDIKLQLQKPDGTRTDLGCCETVTKGDGNLVVITLTAHDDNFSRIAVQLLGGCGVSIPIVDTSSTPLSKTYNGDLSDTGYPVPTEFLWDPFDTPGIEPCCYLVWVDIWDRAILNSSYSGGHYNLNFHSLTIG